MFGYYEWSLDRAGLSGAELEDEFFTRQIDGNYTGTSSPVATCSGPLAFEGEVIA
jgi:hypothetical protein